MPFTALRWQVLAPILCSLALLGSLIPIEEANRSRLANRFSDVTAMRQQLDGNVRDVEERHGRAVRRARESLQEGHSANGMEVLTSVSQHYLKDMERVISDATGNLVNLSVLDADSRLDYDVGRLRNQFEHMLAEAQHVAPVFDMLLEAINSADDNALRHAQRELERVDRSIGMVLRITQEMVRRTCAWQASRATTLPFPIPVALSVALLIWLPTSLWLSQRPLARLSRLSRGELRVRSPLHAWSTSQEEQDLRARLDASDHARDELTQRLAELTRDHERAQLLMRRSEHELALLRFYNENLVNSLRSAIVVTDVSGSITAINRVARALLSMDEAALGTPVEQTQLFAALQSRLQNLRGEIGRAMEERRALRYEAVPFGHGAILLDLTLSPYQDESGAARGLLWVADDVTDAVQTKHQLLLAERLAAVGRLSAQVAHEIRNPLSAIGLNAELLEEDFTDQLSPERGAEARQLLKAIGSEIERLTEVTEAYLQLARLPHPHFREVDVNQLLTDLFLMLAEEMKAHHIAVVMHLATPSPQVHLDPGQLRQALINIIRNSREAMLEGGQLQVGSRSHGTGCVIEIVDTGPGIPCHILPRVFEPFYSTKPHGTGLGLSLTQQIVLEHGGTVEILPRREGGTRVTLSLPDALQSDDD